MSGAIEPIAIDVVEADSAFGGDALGPQAAEASAKKRMRFLMSRRQSLRKAARIERVAWLLFSV